MELAIQSGLQFYVCQRLVEEPEAVGPYLVAFPRKLLGSLSISSVHDFHSAVPEMTEFRLGQGVDPNRSLGASTVFGEYLLETTNLMNVPSR